MSGNTMVVNGNAASVCEEFPSNFQEGDIDDMYNFVYVSGIVGCLILLTRQALKQFFDWFHFLCVCVCVVIFHLHRINHSSLFLYVRAVMVSIYQFRIPRHFSQSPVKQAFLS